MSNMPTKSALLEYERRKMLRRLRHKNRKPVQRKSVKMDHSGFVVAIDVRDNGNSLKFNRGGFRTIEAAVDFARIVAPDGEWFETYRSENLPVEFTKKNSLDTIRIYPADYYWNN